MKHVMVNSVLSSTPTLTQQNIDLIAQDLQHPHARLHLLQASILAALLELHPEQDVWMYEPVLHDPEATAVQATFRLHSSRGVIFHMSCILDVNGNASEWIGPHNVLIPSTSKPSVHKAMAA